MELFCKENIFNLEHLCSFLPCLCPSGRSQEEIEPMGGQEASSFGTLRLTHENYPWFVWTSFIMFCCSANIIYGVVSISIKCYCCSVISRVMFENITFKKHTNEWSYFNFSLLMKVESLQLIQRNPHSRLIELYKSNVRNAKANPRMGQGELCS